MKKPNPIPFLLALALLLATAASCSKKPEAATKPAKENSPPAAVPTTSTAELARMGETARQKAMEEFTRHFTNLGNCWYGYVTKNASTVQMTNMAPRIEGGEVTEEQLKAGLKWGGVVVFETPAKREFHPGKGWSEWKRPTHQLSYSVYNSNGIWIVQNDYGDFFSIPKPGRSPR